DKGYIACAPPDQISFARNNLKCQPHKSRMVKIIQLLKILILLVLINLLRASPPRCDGTDCNHFQDVYNHCWKSDFDYCSEWVQNTNPNFVENADIFCNREASKYCQYKKHQLEGCTQEVEHVCPKPKTTTEEELALERDCQDRATERCHHLLDSLDHYVECWKGELDSCFESLVYSRYESPNCKTVDRHFNVCIAPQLCQMVIYPVLECGY
uniref:Uncharacterized protein n=1 Tax=Clytia hemisphaerica TaxID=252671 RepID=A0A7M6DPN9_9CNID